MKSAVKLMFTVVICLAVMPGYGQTGGPKRLPRPMDAPGTSVAISLKNLSDNKVTIFAGPKDEVNTPQQRKKDYGPQSTHTIYTSVNEVVCIIGTDDKPVSCVDVTPGAEELEIDNTGTVINVKH